MIFGIGLILFCIGGFGYSATKDQVHSRRDSFTANIFAGVEMLGGAAMVISLAMLAYRWLP